MRQIIILFFIGFVYCLQAQLVIIPEPIAMNVDSGRYFIYNKNEVGMKNIPIKNEIVYDKTKPSKNDEGYTLIIDTSEITISAESRKGIYYGQQTLDQIVGQQKTEHGIVKIPCVRIFDAPLYSYRGMHLDVCRHFFSKEVVKQFIDEMALNKMNYFHWHLTDDQGWRIEIKKYPRLTEVGAWRTEVDGSRHGGYYTQDDIREIVNYARERNITIIPEIEMPGHSSAAVAAYAWLSCSGEEIEVPNTYGIKRDIYCPTDSTFQFLKDVLDEVVELFPGPYVHIGGDEVPKAQWKQSAEVRSLKKKHKLRNYEQVQHYFMREMETYLAAKGKRSIGWGEVTRGGLSDSMIVMSWRGRFAGHKAARQGNNVIMAPRFSCYFDYPQYTNEKKGAWWMTYLPLKKVYSFKPRKNLNKQHEIIGGQATLWTEYISTEEQLWHQLKPRMYAMGQVLWSGGNDWENFVKKMEKLQLLKK